MQTKIFLNYFVFLFFCTLFAASCRHIHLREDSPASHMRGDANNKNIEVELVVGKQDLQPCDRDAIKRCISCGAMAALPVGATAQFTGNTIADAGIWSGIGIIGALIIDAIVCQGQCRQTVAGCLSNTIGNVQAIKNCGIGIRSMCVGCLGCCNIVTSCSCSLDECSNQYHLCCTHGACLLLKSCLCPCCARSVGN